jgi:hypothetical protein
MKPNRINGTAVALERCENDPEIRKDPTMTQNHLTARHAESLTAFPRVKERLRDETERTLCDIAYVLHLTDRVKRAMVEDKTPVAAN